MLQPDAIDALAAVAATALLAVVPWLIIAWQVRRRPPSQPWQFSLRGMLVGIVGLALALALVRTFGPGIVCCSAAWVTLMMLLLWVALGAMGSGDD